MYVIWRFDRCWKKRIICFDIYLKLVYFKFDYDIDF